MFVYLLFRQEVIIIICSETLTLFLSIQTVYRFFVDTSPLHSFILNQSLYLLVLAKLSHYTLTFCLFIACGQEKQRCIVEEKKLKSPNYFLHNTKYNKAEHVSNVTFLFGIIGNFPNWCNFSCMFKMYMSGK